MFSSLNATSWLLLLSLLALGCGQEPSPAAHAMDNKPGSGAAPAATSGLGKQAADLSAEAPAPAASFIHQDLFRLLHLADHFEDGGLVIDFGTSARMKYTNGVWNSGWGVDLVDQKTTVSLFGKRGVIYVQSLQPNAPAQIRLRARSVGGKRLTVYLNDQALRTIDAVTDDGYHEYVVPITEAHAQGWRRGENTLMLRGDRVGKFRGNSAAFALDWLRLEGAGASGGDASVGLQPINAGRARQALKLNAGDEAVWHLEVPEQAMLVFGVASAGDAGGTLRVTVRAEGGAEQVLEERAGGAVWSDRQLKLSAVAGKITRLRFQASGGALALSDVRVVRTVAPKPEPTAQARNVIVLLIDTLRASKLQLYNPKSRVTTPALDAFAKQGALFVRSQSPENWTKPAVASLLTSLHPMTHNTKDQGSKLPASALMISEVYKKAGFRTASFIANGYVSNAFGFDKGWDHYTNYIREERSTVAKNVFGEAIRWIEKNKDKRFFVYLQTIDPHVPYDPPDSYLKQYDPEPYNGQIKNRRTHLMLDDMKKNPKKYNLTARDKARLEALHDGEISYHDEHFGKFLARLRELGLEDNTVFVVTSDHGEEFQEHGSWGHGHSVYQELLNVPLLVRWPGVVPAGLRIGPTVSTMDVGPTVLEATGVKRPDEFEGHSLMGFMHDAWPAAPHVAFSDFQDNRRVIRGGDWKLIIRGSLSHVLFDLGHDPAEKHELNGDANPIAMRYLRILLGQYLGATDRGEWLYGAQASATPTKPKRKPVQGETREMNPELCKQLVALGYISAECDKILKKK